LTFQISIK